MRNWNLHYIIGHFDDFIEDVDFAHLPDKESEEYRQLVLKTANDVIFSEGRYTRITEWTLEMFDEQEVCELVKNLKALNKLTDAERVRLGFYLDIKDVCYPLFRGQKIDWSTWPWNLNDGRFTFENKDLFELITTDSLIGQPLPCLQAAILYDMEQQIWKDEEELYSCVSRQEASDIFEHKVHWTWEKCPKTDDEKKALTAAICQCADDLWSIENHVLVGKLLGFDLLTQSIYDSFDTFIDTTYRHNQVLCAQELSAWLKENWTMNEPHPAQEKVEELLAKWKELMAKHDVTSPDERYSWNILTLDALGMSMFSKEEEVDDDPWGDEEIP